MIQQETAARIWNAYREINIANKLLRELEEHLKDPNWKPTPRDSYGRPRQLSMGVPSGDDGSQRLYDVPPNLATSIIRAHIAEQQRVLVKANEQARIEIDTAYAAEATNA